MKFTKSILFTFLTFLLFARTMAQTEAPLEKRNHIGLKLGFDQTYLKDLNYAPLNFKGTGWVADLDYSRRTKKQNLIYSSINFNSTTLKAGGFASSSSDRILGNIAIGYLHHLNLKNEKLALYAGGQYHTYLDLVLFQGGNGLTFFAAHSLELAGRLEYHINAQHKLQTSLSLPLFGLLVRPPYTGWDKFIVENEDSPTAILLRGKWTSLNHFVGINWQTSYIWQLSPRWDLVADYKFRFYHTNQLKAARIATSQLSLGTNFKF